MIFGVVQHVYCNVVALTVMIVCCNVVAGYAGGWPANEGVSFGSLVDHGGATVAT